MALSAFLRVALCGVVPVAVPEPQPDRDLTSLLRKLEESKAAAAARQRPAPGRHWARPAAPKTVTS